MLLEKREAAIKPVMWIKFACGLRVMGDCRHLLWDTDSLSCVAASLRFLEVSWRTQLRTGVTGVPSSVWQWFRRALCMYLYVLPYTIYTYWLPFNVLCIKLWAPWGQGPHTIHSSFWIKMNSEEYNSWWTCLILVSHQCDECTYE